jgi:hypothetical protein
MIKGRMMVGRATRVWRGDGKGRQNDWGQNDGGTGDACVVGRRKGMAE